MTLSRRTFMQLSGSAALAAAAGQMTQAGRAYSADSDKKVRMAVVGGNFGATFHWHEHPNCVVTAVTDLIPKRRDALRDHYKCDNVYDSLEEMLAKEKNVDAIGIFSGALDHVKHAKMCMEKGWHVVSACPACFTLEEAEILKEVKERTGLKYMMAESSYYRSEVIFARNLCQSKDFGEVFYSEVEYYHDRGDLEKLVSNTKTRFYEPDGSYSWRWVAGFCPVGRCGPSSR